MIKLHRYLLLSPALLVPARAFADAKSAACQAAGGVISGTECVLATGNKSLFGGGSFFQGIVDTLIFVVGAVSVLMIILGGLRYVLSGGDSAGVKGAKDTILYAIVGLVVAAMAYAIVHYVVGKV